MGKTGATSKWFSSLPEAHYDLIARIMPGALTLVLAAILYCYCTVGAQNVFSFQISPASTTSSLGSDLVFLAVATSLSWCLGMLLTPLGSGIHALFFSARVFRTFCNDKDNETNLNAAVKLEFIKSPTDGGEWATNRKRGKTDLQAKKTYQELHDGLKEALPTARVIIEKPQAERVFYECTSAGLLILIVVCAFLALQASPKQPLVVLSQPAFSFVVALILLLFFLSLWGQWFKANRVWLRHGSLLFIYLKQQDRKAAPAEAPRRETSIEASANKDGEQGISAEAPSQPPMALIEEL
jgi:hypothetical protein